MTDTPNIPQDVLDHAKAAMSEISAAIDALDPERKALLLNLALSKVDDLVRDAAQSDSHREVAEYLSFIHSVTAFAGLVNASSREEHEDWTRTGDVKVDAVWDLYVSSIRATTAVGLTKEEVPDEIVERITAGEATEEDYAFLKRLAAEKAGIDPDDLQIATIDGQAPEAPSAADGKGYGMYL